MKSASPLLGILLLTFLFPISAMANQDSLLEARKDTALTLYQELAESKEDAERDSLGAAFDETMKELLTCKGAFKDSFAALSERIGILYAPGKDFRLFTWNVPYANGTHEYFAYFLRPDRDGRIHIHEPEAVLSASDRNKKKKGGVRKDELERTDLERGTWIPALYYRIIKKERKGEVLYTLLGWEGKDRLSTRKTIEVLRFEEGQLHFGAPIFKKEEEKGEKKESWREKDRKRRRRARGKEKAPAPKQRVIFEYTDDAIMTLKYEKAKDRIVFNQLVPERPDLEGMYEFYGPDLFFDAYAWNPNGYWNFQKKVEPENESEGQQPWNDPEE